MSKERSDESDKPLQPVEIDDVLHLQIPILCRYIARERDRPLCTQICMHNACTDTCTRRHDGTAGQHVAVSTAYRLPGLRATVYLAGVQGTCCARLHYSTKSDQVSLSIFLKRTVASARSIWNTLSLTSPNKDID